MKKKIFNAVKYISFLSVGIFLVWWSLRQIPDDKWGEFKTAFSTANYWLMVPVFLILSASHVLRAIRWRMLMYPLGYRPSFANTFFAVMIGYLVNLAIPRLGEVMKCTILAKYDHVPAEKLVGTIVAERAFDLLCLLVVFIAAFALQYDVIGDFGINLFRKAFLGKSGTFDSTKFAIVAAILLIIIIAVWQLLKRYDQIKIVHRIHGILTGVWQGLVSVKDLKHKWGFIFCSIGIWGLYLLGTWVGFYGTVGTAGLPFQVAVSGLAFASIGMIVSPGGIGAYAVFLAKVLQRNGVDYELGLANGTIQWFAQFLIIVIVGFISLGLLPWFNKKTGTDETTPINPQ